MHRGFPVPPTPRFPPPFGLFYDPHPKAGAGTRCSSRVCLCRGAWHRRALPEQTQLPSRCQEFASPTRTRSLGPREGVLGLGFASPGPGAAPSCCLWGQRGGGDGVGARGVDARPQFFDDLGQKCVRAVGTRRNHSFLLPCPRLTLGVVTWGLGSALGSPKPRGSWRWQLLGLLAAPPGGENPIPGALVVSSPHLLSPVEFPPSHGHLQRGRAGIPPALFWGGW